MWRKYIWYIWETSTDMLVFVFCRPTRLPSWLRTTGKSWPSEGRAHIAPPAVPLVREGSIGGQRSAPRLPAQGTGHRGAAWKTVVAWAPKWVPSGAREVGVVRTVPRGLTVPECPPRSGMGLWAPAQRQDAGAFSRIRNLPAAWAAGLTSVACCTGIPWRTWMMTFSEVVVSKGYFPDTPVLNRVSFETVPKRFMLTSQHGVGGCAALWVYLAQELLPWSCVSWPDLLATHTFHEGFVDLKFIILHKDVRHILRQKNFCHMPIYSLNTSQSLYSLYPTDI